MSNELLVITKYVISGRRVADNARVYYASAARSGGYPYWSERIDSIDVFTYPSTDGLTNLPPFRQTQGGVVDVEVLKVDTNVYQVSKETMATALREKANREIAKIVQDLEDQLKHLEVL